MKTPRNTPHHPDTHLQEREHIRRIRRHRPLGEISTKRFPVLVRNHGDLLGALREYCQRLQSNGDSYEAWLGLSRLFESMRDFQRSDMCRGIARQLRTLAVASGYSSRN